MARHSSILEDPDREEIERGIDAGESIKSIATRLDKEMGRIARYRTAYLNRKKVAAPAGAPEPERATVAKSSDLQIQDAPGEPARIGPKVIPAAPLSDDIDIIEATNGSAHLHRLKRYQELRFRGHSQEQCAKALGKGLRTAERWEQQIKKDRRLALVKLDIGQVVVDALAFANFTRAQQLLNADECLKRLDFVGHRQAVSNAAKIDAARVGYVRELVELGIVNPTKTAGGHSERVHDAVGDLIRSIMAPLLNAPPSAAPVAPTTIEDQSHE
jgi:hypothetical protein